MKTGPFKIGKNFLILITILIFASFFVAYWGLGEEIKGVRDMRYGIDIRGGVEAVFEPADTDQVPSAEELETAREVIEMRLDAQNISDREVTIDKQGGYIIVRFPWKSDESNFEPEKAIAELGNMAQLTFQNAAGEVLLEGKNVASSSAVRSTENGTNEYVVELKFDKEGAEKFEEITGSMIGQQLGIYMDGQLISNPQIISKISGGSAVITGMENYEEAKTLSDQINAGALPFSLETTSFSTVSPALGNQALNVMTIAGIAAFFVVCGFMVLVYRLPGAVASFMLAFQMILLLLSVSIPQYTLTLPGIAGIILSMGMAVDANIIISERISEELRTGKTIQSAITIGYKNGFTSVFDGNMTTAVIAVILMIFGSGTMKSFGYTLLAGMIVNVLIGVNISKKILLSLNTCGAFSDTKYYCVKKELKVKKFYEKKYLCAIISGLVLVAGVAGIFIRGVRLDIQFTGGTVLEYQISESVPQETIEQEVQKATGRAVTVQETVNRVNNGKNLEITLAGQEGISPESQMEVMEIITENAPDIKIAQTQTYSVEPYIGEKSLQNALIAVALSLVFILLYVCFRFSNLSGFAAGVMALIALLHDVLVCFFIFVFWGIPLNDAFVAVILTIIGYSINDTIVVYDRIRENRNSNEKQELVELTNTSISQVLNRSINTSLTTAICVAAILVVSIFYQIPSIFEFSLPMLFGLISGCYSSICVASILWVMWEKRWRRL